MKKENINKIFEKFHMQSPEPKGELYYHNHFTLLIAVVLSAQATDKGVNKATKHLFEFIEKPQDILDLGIDQLTHHIKSIGLYKAKARNIMLLSQQLLDKHNGSVPDNFDDLQALAGVGRKTANVVLNIAFGHPTIAVDTHLFRIANRTKLARGTTPEQIEKKLTKAIPKQWQYHAHNWLILHGRYICKARKPLCNQCIIIDECGFKEKNLA